MSWVGSRGSLLTPITVILSPALGSAICCAEWPVAPPVVCFHHKTCLIDYSYGKGIAVRKWSSAALLWGCIHMQFGKMLGCQRRCWSVIGRTKGLHWAQQLCWPPLPLASHQLDRGVADASGVKDTCDPGEHHGCSGTVPQSRTSLGGSQPLLWPHGPA